jgi:hypothetical protein
VAQVIGALASGVSAQVGPVSESQVGPLQPKKEEKKKTWIGIQLKDFKGQPMPNHNFQVTLDSGQVLRGRTDSKGYARFDNLDPDSGNVAFTELTETKDKTDAQRGSTEEAAGSPASADYDNVPMPGSEDEELTSLTDVSNETLGQELLDENEGI